MESDQLAAPSLSAASDGYWAQVMAGLLRPRAIAIPVVTFVVLSIAADVGWGVVGGFVALIYVVVDAFKSARGRAREAFFDSYAGARGLEQREGAELPPVAPLLRMGDDRHVERVMNGTLPGGLHGALALYTYENQSYDSQGNGKVDAHPFTVVVLWLPGVEEKVVELHCEPRTAFRSPAGEAGLSGMRRLQLESVALDKRYEITHGPGEDENWLRRLYIPTFIVWLAERSPREFAFQLSEGYLCAFVPGHYETAAHLDALCEATAVVGRRLAEEVAES